MRSIVPIVARAGKRHALTFERGAALLGLVAIAIAQPIFEVVANSPEFFPARSTPPATIVAAVLAMCLALPLVLLGIERAIRAVSRSAATAFQGLVVAVLSAALVMPWFRRGELLVFPWDAAIGAFIGLAVAFAYTSNSNRPAVPDGACARRAHRPVTVFPRPGVKQSFLPSESAAALETIERTPPIVLVVFDELPMNSLLDAKGNIDAERYPNFGALAREAYWFRNASTVAYMTAYARASHSVGPIRDDRRGRADAAALPGQSLHRAGASLRDFCVDEVPAALSARVRVNRTPRFLLTRSRRSCRTSVSSGCTSFCRRG